jgi:3'-5' exoribonuclease
MKDIYIADLANFDEGKSFDGFFIVLAKQQRMTKNNKPYLNLILGDKTGQLEGRVWELSDPRIAKDFERGDVVKARGSASRFDYRTQMQIEHGTNYKAIHPAEILLQAYDERRTGSLQRR